MSCRRGVPKNDCSCCKSLAEKVRELWERAANAIKTINGVQADGANNFDILPGAGIQVNPRANGIEIVATGATPPDDSIKTINYVQPDADGDFILRGGTGVDIEEIEDEEGINGLEISCTVEAPTYTGVSPIIIDADTNEISLEGWTKVSGTDWRFLAENGATKYDILIGFNYQEASLTYIPKGTPTTLRLTRVTGSYYTNTIRSSNLYYLLSNVLNTGTTVYDTKGLMWFEIEATGSGINERLIYRYHNAEEYIGTGLNKEQVQLYYR